MGQGQRGSGALKTGTRRPSGKNGVFLSQIPQVVAGDTLHLMVTRSPRATTFKMSEFRRGDDIHKLAEYQLARANDPEFADWDDNEQGMHALSEGTRYGVEQMRQSLEGYRQHKGS